MALYSEKVMDHFRNPRNVGIIEDANGIGEVGNAKCGDIMKMYLKIEDDIIQDVKFETFGCGSAIASSSMATELIKGKPVSEAMKLTNQAVAEALDGLPAYKMHCSVLAEEAIQSALEDYQKRQTEKCTLFSGRERESLPIPHSLFRLTNTGSLGIMNLHSLRRYGDIGKIEKDDMSGGVPPGRCVSHPGLAAEKRQDFSFRRRERFSWTALGAFRWKETRPDPLGLRASLLRIAFRKGPIPAG